eukprot:2244933-Rhodomonas_salina.1
MDFAGHGQNIEQKASALTEGTCRWTLESALSGGATTGFCNPSSVFTGSGAGAAGFEAGAASANGGSFHVTLTLSSAGWSACFSCPSTWSAPVWQWHQDRARAEECNEHRVWVSRCCLQKASMGVCDVLRAQREGLALREKNSSQQRSVAVESGLDVARSRASAIPHTTPQTHLKPVWRCEGDDGQ